MQANTLENGSRVYLDLTGVNYPSVTTIRSATESEKERDRLKKWRNKMDKTHGAGAGNQKRDDRANEGKNAHKLIEEYLTGRGDFPDCKFTRSAGNILRFLRQNVVASEMLVYYPHPNGYAGILDLILPFEGKLTVFDFVTSERLKREEWLSNKFLQTTAYSLAYGINVGELPKQVGAIVLSPKGCQIFTKPVEELKDEWWQRVDRFYSEELWRELGLHLG